MPKDQRATGIEEIKFVPNGPGALGMSITVNFVFLAELGPTLLERVDMARALLQGVCMRFASTGQGDDARTWTWKDKMGPAQLEIDSKSFTEEEGPDPGLGGIIKRPLARGD
ncbi:MAG: hypothetical protein ACHQRJ_25545 [Alphaproteobacteria bacterium]